MKTRPALRLVALLILAWTVLSFIPVLQPPETALAQACESQTSEELELKYDDGVPIGTMKAMGCEACSAFQGVRFTLPEGLPTAILTGVRFEVPGSSDASAASLWVYITGPDHVNTLVPPIPYSATTGGWQTAAVGNIVVPHDFWLIIKRTSEDNMLYYDAARLGPKGSPLNRSFYGYDLTHIIDHEPPGDFMLRAEVKAEVNVGQGQAFRTIQEAIDAVGEGTRIVVHDGTYVENVTIDKALYVTSLSGAGNTIVTAPVADTNTFTITSPCVTLSGFTIQGATAAGSAGVSLDGVSGCLIKGNTVLDNDRGIYIGPGASANILLRNECEYNTEGIYLDGLDNYVSGNKIHGNRAVIGSAVFVSDNASGNTLRFNTIQVDQGTDPAVASGPQVCAAGSTQQVDAVNNWWGSATGPASGANPGGVGSKVGDAVLFDPWLKSPPVFVETVAAPKADYALDLTKEASASVAKTGLGEPVISFASFAEDPFDQFTGKPLGRWIDVLFSSTTDVKQVVIEVHYTADEVASLNRGSLRLYWWNTDKEKWTVCSLTGVDKVNGFVWAKVNVSSKPSLNDLGGTFFTAGAPKGGGFAWWIVPVVIVLVLLLLVAFRLFWVLAVKRQPM